VLAVKAGTVVRSGILINHIAKWYNTIRVKKSKGVYWHFNLEYDHINHEHHEPHEQTLVRCGSLRKNIRSFWKNMRRFLEKHTEVLEKGAEVFGKRCGGFRQEMRRFSARGAEVFGARCGGFRQEVLFVVMFRIEVLT
jgi:hypothetical protein